MAQQSSVVFTIGLVLTLLAGFYKFAYNVAPPPPILTIPAAPSGVSPPSSSSSSSPGGSDSGETPESPSHHHHPPAVGDLSPSSSSSSSNTAIDNGFTDPLGATEEVDMKSVVGGPEFEGCIDVAHEETANQVVILKRMVAFKPDFKKWQKFWGDRLVFSDVTPALPQPSAKKSGGGHQQKSDSSSRHEPAPIMNQWLYCYTSNYSEDYSLKENNDCTAELAGLDEPVAQDAKYFIGRGLPHCTISPVFQGNITSWAALSPIVKQFPGPLSDSERTLESLSKSRNWMWKNMPDPFSLSCPTCRETKDLIHPTFLAGARRWFSVRRWVVMTRSTSSSSSDGGSSGENANSNNNDIKVEIGFNPCMVFLEKSIRTSKDLGDSTRCTGLSEPNPGDVKKWAQDIPFSSIVDVAFALVPGDSAFFAFTALVDDEEQQQQKKKLVTYVMTPIMGIYGVEQIWVSMQMLFGFDISDDATTNSGGRGHGGRRGLFSKTRPIFPRNITAAVEKEKCWPQLLMAHKNNQQKHTLQCWTDIVSVTLVASENNNKNSNSVVVAGGGAATAKTAGSLLRSVEKFPYLPCHPPYMTALVSEARRHNNMDTHGLYWPFSCSVIAHRRPCIEDRINSILRLKSHKNKPQINLKKNVRMRELVRPKVAVCIAGFIRSFHLTSHAIFQNLVDPYDADFFAAAWNVQGRVKKTDPILKGHVINVDRMRRRLINLIPKRNRNVTALINAGRYAVQTFSFRMYEQMLADWKKAGFRHAGLYMLLARSIEMAMARAEVAGPYDVVIRSRFDLVPLVPFQILPVWAEPDRQRQQYFARDQSKDYDSPTMSASASGGGGSFFKLADAALEPHNNKKFSSSSSSNNNNNNKVAAWMIDTGSACEMDGFWWPRTAILRDGVVVAHTADTRYKLFSWQFCDWVHIGTYDTMVKMSKLYDWAIHNYVDSGAQFIEQIYAIDQGLRFYPMQLYLKILRETIKKPKKMGKRVLKIRRHLFG